MNQTKWRERSTKEKVIRALIHVPVGICNAFLLYAEPVFGILFFTGFFIYEIEESYHLKDGAFLDIYGWLCGFAGLATPFFILRLLSII